MPYDEPGTHIQERFSADQLDKIAEYVAGFYPAGTPVDWDDALYRIEVAFGIDLPEQMTDPLILKIKRTIRAYRRETKEA